MECGFAASYDRRSQLNLGVRSTQAQGGIEIDSLQRRTMIEPSGQLIFTNSQVYRQIAEDAHRSAIAELNAHRTPHDDGRPGYVIRFDPERRSFKQSMIAIVFAGMYIESRLWIVGCQRLGRDAYSKIDQRKIEERLPPLGITDASLVADCKAYRESRKILVHEKAVPIHEDVSPSRVAQDEATVAVRLMTRVDHALAASTQTNASAT